MSAELVIDPPAQRPTDTLMLIERALEKGLDPTQLSAFMDLHERAEKSRAAAQFAVALSAAQAEMPCIVKDAVNTHTKSRYARLETITHDIKPVYTKHGLSLSFEPEMGAAEGFIRVRADLRCGSHLQSYRVDMPKDGKGAQGNQNAMNPLQAHGSTFSYARRYLVCMIFDLVIAGEDLDGNDESQFITGDQIGEINDLIGRSVADLQKFLKWLSIESLDKMRTDQFEKAIRELKRKAQNGGSK